ncbi:MAG: glycerol-3-phosphate 1-O-acyltransferase PlsY [Alphaproteobacteria bacterium]|nr:glycerol-3-phosphate 1-O-acyltransferase PlsY [Alphaproteobacteria bacterium]
MEFIAAIALGYLLGSVPFGLVLTRLAGIGDIRNVGSGNIGATNVLRTGKKSLAFFTLLLDGGKGAVAALIAEFFVPGAGQFAGLAALIGHLFPVWLRFKGGKGVATSLGVLTAIAWPVGIAAMLCWLITAVALRYSSLSALVAVGLSPLASYLLGYDDVIWLATVIAVLVFVSHKDNICRLINGSESKIGSKHHDDAASLAKS